MDRLGKLLTIVVLLCQPVITWGQTLDADEAGLPLPSQVSEASEVGLPFPSEHFAPQEYRQYPQNWAVTQDDRGLIYVANNDGILEYDGESWRLIPTVTNTFVRSLTTSEAGTVYAGVVGDFGYLEPDSAGVMRYQSLFEEIPSEHQSFDDVWGAHTTSGGVYFQTNERLFRWDGANMKVWTGEGGFHTSFVVRNDLYVRDFQAGLLKMVDDSLQRVPSGERFAETPIHMMLPISDNRILIGTNRDGLFLYDGDSLKPFSTEATAFLNEYELYYGCLLSNGRVALATIGGGVLVLDQQGRIERVLGPSAELPDGVVHYVYKDMEGGLWMAFNSSGVARTEVTSPLSQYNEQVGLDGLIYNIERHREQLYVATGSGLFVLEEQPLSLAARQENKRTGFRKITGIPISWDLESTEAGLLVATEMGMFLIQGGDAEQLTRGARHTARTVISSDHFSGWFFVGGRQGLTALHHLANSWDVHIVPGIDDEIHSVVEGEDGVLWLSTAQGDVLRLVFSGTPSAKPSVERFRSGGALPSGFNRVTSINQDVVVLSKHGVFSTNLHRGANGVEASPEQPEANFVLDTRFRIDANEASLLSLIEDPRGNVWMLRGTRTYMGRQQPDGAYVWEEIPNLHFPKAEESLMYMDENGVLWMGNGRELIRYDPQEATPPDETFPVYVRQVTALRDQDVLYGGALPATEQRSTVQHPWSQIRYENNDLRFDFAAPRFGNLTPIEYQYQLEGVDSGWSDWQSSTNVVYSDLTEGDYTFRVRAREGEDLLSQEASFQFGVLPPWYRTWWAYSAYFIAFVVLGLAYQRYYQVMQENERVKEQARELERERIANERLQEANERLKQANELKDNFLANTSHELRTPLTTILGFTDVLKEEAPTHHQEFLTIIEKSGQRLLRTLNALLDLAKLRSGVVEARFDRIDVVAKAEELLDMFRHDASRKHIDLELKATERPMYSKLDDRYYEQVLDNLISNAIKFTDEGGIVVDIDQDHEWIYIRITDTGAGIDKSFIPLLFDDFKQESTGLDRDHEGSGLGLAITSRLVALMHGTIDVESTKGKGSTFTVTFPRYEPPTGAAQSEAESTQPEQA